MQMTQAYSALFSTRFETHVYNQIHTKHRYVWNRSFNRMATTQTDIPEVFCLTFWNVLRLKAKTLHIYDSSALMLLQTFPTDLSFLSSSATSTVRPICPLQRFQPLGLSVLFNGFHREAYLSSSTDSTVTLICALQCVPTFCPHLVSRGNSRWNVVYVQSEQSWLHEYYQSELVAGSFSFGKWPSYQRSGALLCWAPWC